MIIDVNTAASLLLAGEIVAIPTETVYGLACILTDEAAKKVYAAKGRPSDNPFIVHIANPDELTLVAEDIPEAARLLAGAFWPGPLTMVLKKRQDIPKTITANLETVAVRCPSHPIAREIIRLTGPLAAPSANRSGTPSPTRAEHVLADLDVPVVDGGPCEIGLESTVISLCGSKPRLLRPGGVTAEQLCELIGELDVSAPEPHDAAPPSPGMKYRHYSPKTKLTVVDDTSNPPPDGFILVPEGETGDLVYTAETLYDILRYLDTLGLSEAFVRCPKPEGIGLALCDRLYRAAGYKP